MLADWEMKAPGRKDVMLKALGNGNPSHLLDHGPFDFATLDIRRERGSWGGGRSAVCSAPGRLETVRMGRAAALPGEDFRWLDAGSGGWPPCRRPPAAKSRLPRW